MSIDLVEKFLPYVDEQFAAESKLGMVTNQYFAWDGAHAVRVYKVTTAQMNDYGRTGPTGDNWRPLRRCRESERHDGAPAAESRPLLHVRYR